MNILHIRSQYIVDGGVETFLNALVANMTQTSCTHHFLILTTAGMERPFFFDVLPRGLYNKSCAVVWNKKKFFTDSVQPVLDILEEWDIDLVHSHDNRANLIMLLIRYLHRNKTPWLTSGHGWVDQPLKSKLIGELDKFLSRFADRVHFAAKSLYSQVKFIPGNRLTAIPYFLNEDKFQHVYDTWSFRQSFNIAKDKIILGMVGRLGEEKGHEFLLKAMKLLIQRYDDIVLVIVGDGPLREKLHTMTTELAIENHVIFTGFYEDSLMACAAFDIFFHSSLNESHSIVITEAMLLGKPIIATTVGANRDVVAEGENGFLVPPRDSLKLADAAARLLDKRELIGQFGKESQNRVKRHFAPSLLTQNYEALYRELCG